MTGEQRAWMPRNAAAPAGARAQDANGIAIRARSLMDSQLGDILNAANQEKMLKITAGDFHRKLKRFLD